ncbi:3-dehydroquinate dehydratase [Candidatus Photodesmus blepharus]|uniref:3-dehydroquinate dehydratase n=1 Tax=Candidatus Photodesmus blepharonis TaxID=1179155 RepID=A0A084CN83_9GAMM|nr:type II 3-dehydroquinate dehydratase [Candidatus Photodesmus blepharus]KEY91262.1 3-dehydroquinate dehydratase [Candidatus Photodesmus blepharus]
MFSKLRVLIINGPNLNLLGLRESIYYGFQPLAQIIDGLQKQAKEEQVELECLQLNREYELVEAVHNALGKISFIIINPAAFTHTSVVLRDALLGVEIPFIEVHLSNIYAREPFRHRSYLSDKAQGVICGFGSQGYQFALSAAITYLRSK